MKKLLLVLIAIFLSSAASAQVTYSVDAGVEKTEINTTAVVSCDRTSSNCPVNSWSLQWNIPEDAIVKSISDSQGPIEDYERTNDVLQIQTNTGPRRTSEKIQINIVKRKEAEEIVDGLYRRSISLSGFSGKTNSGEVIVEDFLSSKISRAFQKSYSDDSIIFRGTGAGNIRLNFGKGFKSDYYTFFGAEKNGSLAYRISVGTTGLRQSYPSIPVVVLAKENYNNQVSDWSQGEYSSGVIKVRDTLGESFQPVLAEETVHAFNDEVLSFDTTSSTWLDEGIGSYTQSMVRRKMLGDRKTRNLFGEETSYTITENGSRYRISKPSKGNREDLWRYYQENQNFMLKWNPTKVDAKTRKFGYAYSELIIRNYVSKGESVRKLYQEIDTNQTLDTNEEKWNYINQYIDLTPCRYESRQRFDNCLDRINNYDYRVYSASEIPEANSKPIQVQELETPNYTERNIDSIAPSFRNEKLFSKSIINSILEFLNSLFDDL